MSLRRSWWLVALVVSLLGAACGGGQGRRELTPAPSPDSEPARAPAVDALVTRLVAARGLAPRRPIRVERLGRKAFVARLVGGDSVRESGLTPEATLLLGFNFMPPPDARGKIVPFSALLADEVAGFYDVDDDRVVVPDDTRLSRREQDNARAVLVHELQHAIQAQHFARDPKELSPDASLARRALYEGDATAAMAATLGLEADEPVQRTLRRLGDVTRRYRADAFHPERDERVAALPLARAELDFPYEEGVLFVGDLYRAGGFGLIDRAFDRPPTTTEHVLHTEKYLAGELPHTFGEIPLPTGHHQVATGSLGELRTRTFFRQCYDPSFADAVAAGWNGDAFRMSVGEDRRIIVSWVSAWDSDDDAIEVENAVRTATSCFARNRLGEPTDDYEVGDRVVVRRVGRVVAMIRGSEAPDDARLDRMVALASATAPVRPLGDVSLAPRLTLPEPRPGRVRRGRYESAWLGLSAVFPRVWRAEPAPDAEAVVRTEARDALGYVFVSRALASGDALDRTFRRTVRDVERDLGDSLVREGPRRRRSFAVGTAFEEVFSAKDDVRVHVVLSPVCNATGAIGFVVAAPSGKSAPLTEDLVASFVFDGGRNIPACAYLDPK